MNTQDRNEKHNYSFISNFLTFIKTGDARIPILSVVLLCALISSDIIFNSGAIHNKVLFKQTEQNPSYYDEIVTFSVAVVRDYEEWERLVDYQASQRFVDRLRTNCIQRFHVFSGFEDVKRLESADLELYLVMMEAANAIICADLNGGKIYIDKAISTSRVAQRMLREESRFNTAWLTRGVVTSIFALNVYSKAILYVSLEDENAKRAVGYELIDYVNQYFRKEDNFLRDKFVNRNTRRLLVELGILTDKNAPVS